MNLPTKTELDLPTANGVTFRFVPDIFGYAVGDDGSVWSCLYDRRNKIPFGTWRPLTPIHHNTGYREVKLYTGSSPRRIRRLVHRLILEVFVGPCPDGCQACHNDGTRTNNKLTNLRWDTFRENALDRLRHGTNVSHPGQRNGRAKLTDDIIRTIRSEYPASTLRKLGSKYGVDSKTIHKIVTRRHWSHVA